MRPGSPHRSRRARGALAGGLAPIALAAVTIAGPAAGAAESAAAAPEVSPRPQKMTVTGAALDLAASVTVVRGVGADPAAVTATLAALAATNTSVTITTTDPGTGDTVYVGGPTETAPSRPALVALGVTAANGPRQQGYVLASGTDSRGRKRVVLSGHDKVGTFYAAQTLRQLLSPDATGASIDRVTIEDWPGFGFRGGMDSANPPPPGVARWTTADRLEQVEVLARNKMNRFFYGPAIDPRTGGLPGQGSWRTEYSTQELNDFAAIVAKAKRLHVDFIYRISPAAPLDQAYGICHSSADDRAKLLARLDTLRSKGVRHFVVAWDDIAAGEQFTCPADTSAYGTPGPNGTKVVDKAAWARAQAAVTNYVQTQFIAKNALPQLFTVPTEYAGGAASSYRAVFDQSLSPAVGIYWTGPEVISPTIGVADLTAASQTFPRHTLAIWDNYPVNDQVWDRLHLGPVQGRDAGLGRAPGILFNEMTQQGPSQLPLLTAADYAWNPANYDAEKAWGRAIATLGASRAADLRTFAELNRSSALTHADSLALAEGIDAFRQALRTNTNVAATASTLKQKLTSVRAAGTNLQTMQTSFASQARPWLQQTVRLADAGSIAVDLLVAERNGQTMTAETLRAQLIGQLPSIAAEPAAVGAGVLPALVSFALRRGIDTIDLSGDGRADVLAVNSAGELKAYENQRTTYNWPELEATGVRVGEGWSASMLPIPGDLDGDRLADLLAVTPSGQLMQYRNTGASFGSIAPNGVQVGSGWQGALAVRSADLDADGRADLLGVFPDGSLLAFRNTGMSAAGAVTWAAPLTVGQGWSANELPFVGDLNADGRADLMTIKPDGTLWHFLNTGSLSGTTFAAGQKVGQGWTGYLDMHVVDLDGDARADVLGVMGNGELRAFRNAGVTPASTGAYVRFGAGVSVGGGWSASNLPVPTDFNGDGRADLVSIASSGYLVTNVNAGRFDSGLMFPTGVWHGPGWTGTQFLR
ncbi:beta-N-acetylglucosaminidase domain-containing protein [Terrabacter sp. MAHUQ-38]|uniref:beta-N-acetylglucosaminidase domain-containing protein n=1 Tax=unclassified Terrabacter TaxID=2630222 RepID=UPI002102C1C6|nr:beta-N-acetylglucosaminidase domain-containing protein [Terrabacter sp. MAHUQ-38]